MTASDGPEAGPAAEHAVDPGAALRSAANLAMDVFVYAPAGALLTAASDVPAMAAKGRARIDQELRNAHLVGRFVVDTGVRRMRGQLEHLMGERRGQEPGSSAAPPPRAAARPATGPSATRPSATRPSAPRPAGPAPRTDAGIPGAPGAAGADGGATPARDTAVDRAIPDYDTLSASQVVRRLDGLKPRELRAVVRHELANRGRRTILHRAEQLLGEAPPSSPPPVTT